MRCPNPAGPGQSGAEWELRTQGLDVFEQQLTVADDGLGVGVWDKEESRWREMYFGVKN